MRLHRKIKSCGHSSITIENVVPPALDAIVDSYQQTLAQENGWLERLEESHLSRTVVTAYLPNREIAVREALLQVCLHSQWHRAGLNRHPPA